MDNAEACEQKQPLRPHVLGNGIYGSLQLPGNCMIDVDAITKAAGDLVKSTVLDGKKAVFAAPADFVCSICLAEDEENGFALTECGHFACRECWLTMVAYSLSQSRVPIKCMVSFLNDYA
jgi:hypothetical protein